jgi:Peptidase family M28/PDZ domain/PA domain
MCAAFVAGLALAALAAAQSLGVRLADPVRYLNHVKALTTPAMEGRGDGTKGLSRAAQLLEDEYKRLGLEPAGTQRFFQPFELTTGARLAGKNALIEQNGARKALRLNEDFVPFSFSSSGEANGAVVFAGYGVTAPELGYDDYAGLDVTGKIVLMLRYEPAGFAAHTGNQGMTQHASLITKAINARDHGAKGVVVVNGTPGGGNSTGPQGGAGGPSPERAASGAGAPGGDPDPLMKFGSISGPTDSHIVFVQTRNRVAQGWMAASGKSLAELQKQIDGTMQPASFALPDTLHVTVRTGVEQTRATVSNVLAYLPGKSDEYIILGAHYDHLGYGGPDSLAPSQIGQIHPGADDNASGTAGVLELARLLAPLKGKLDRGILFMSFAGEELGLLGSAEWVREPTRPLGKAVAMINMDMIGRIKDDKVYVGGVGTGSTFDDLLKTARANSPFQMDYSQSGYAASDHTSFVGRKIPVLFFFSGLHADYHKPSDTWEKINAPDAARLLDVIAKVTLELDAAAARPQFVAVAPESDPHSGVTTGISSGGGGYGPYFGSIPDFSPVESGVRFSDVTPNSPAARAGLKGGDVLVQFGNMAIHDLYDFTDALRASNVGQMVQVTVLRDGMRLAVTVTLEQRR